jgi:hypothetical protein
VLIASGANLGLAFGNEDRLGTNGYTGIEICRRDVFTRFRKAGTTNVAYLFAIAFTRVTLDLTRPTRS